jgi:hypothetical protein
MRDADVRRVLRVELERTHEGDSDTLIIEELGLFRGAVRLDIAVVNGALKGYEIKSAQDTLDRLPAQAAAYSRIFDTMTVVVAEKHLRRAESMIPDWWGTKVVVARDGSSLMFERVRDESFNREIDPRSVVQLLWRDEVLSLLDQTTGLKSLKSKPRQVLWEALARAVPLSELRGMVRTCLKSRPRWRVASQRTRGDERCLPCAMSTDSPDHNGELHTRRYTRHPS